jgi:hypothetical protein
MLKNFAFDAHAPKVQVYNIHYNHGYFAYIYNVDLSPQA